jgi:hypothetical protein
MRRRRVLQHRPPVTSSSNPAPHPGEIARRVRKSCPACGTMTAANPAASGATDRRARWRGSWAGSDPRFRRSCERVRERRERGGDQSAWKPVAVAVAIIVTIGVVIALGGGPLRRTGTQSCERDSARNQACPTWTETSANRRRAAGYSLSAALTRSGRCASVTCRSSSSTNWPRHPDAARRPNRPRASCLTTGQRRPDPCGGETPSDRRRLPCRGDGGELAAWFDRAG